MIDFNGLWAAGLRDIRPTRTEPVLRSAISKLYYSVFHRLTASGAALAAQGHTALQAQIARAYSHAQMARVCEAYAKSPKPRSASPLDNLVPIRNADLVGLSIEFPNLQFARHRADYDLATTVTFDDAFDVSQSAAKAHAAWSGAEGTHDATIFLTALLLHDKWTRRG